VADRSARILLVDDEQSIQTLLSYPLRKEGYEVVQATDGRAALDRFEEQPFDLVVLDLMLPKVGSRSAAAYAVAARSRSSC
jgi:DNA-binding response OmpR family regulator